MGTKIIKKNEKVLAVTISLPLNLSTIVWNYKVVKVMPL